MPLLIFVLIALTLACAMVSLSFAVSRGRRGQGTTVLNAKRLKHAKLGRINIKYYKAAVLVILLSVESMVLLPWVLYPGKTFKDITNMMMFIFIMSIFIISHIFVLLSKELDWKK